MIPVVIPAQLFTAKRNYRINPSSPARRNPGRSCGSHHQQQRGRRKRYWIVRLDADQFGSYDSCKHEADNESDRDALIATKRNPVATTSCRTSAPFAPSAIRIPISCVFRAVEYASTRKRPPSPEEQSDTSKNRHHREAKPRPRVHPLTNEIRESARVSQSHSRILVQTCFRITSIMLPGSCAVRTISTRGGIALIEYGTHNAGSIGACSPRFVTSPTTPMISNDGSDTPSRFASHTCCPIGFSSASICARTSRSPRPLSAHP